jgi:hypothetical protein
VAIPKADGDRGAVEVLVAWELADGEAWGVVGREAVEGATVELYGLAAVEVHLTTLKGARSAESPERGPIEVAAGEM